MFHVRVNVQQFLSSRFLQRRGGKRLSVPLEIYSRELTNLPKRVQILFRSNALCAPRRATFVVLLRVVAPTANFNKRERRERASRAVVHRFLLLACLSGKFFLYGENSALKRHPKRTQRNEECTTLNKTFVSAPFPLNPLSEKKTTTTKRKRERGGEFQEKKRFCDDDGLLMRR
jgi:hypothetical protein